MFSRLKRRLRAVLRRGELERELDDELQYHLTREIEQLVASGMTEPAARATARKYFGGVEQAKEQCREARGVWLIEDLRQDLSYAVRTLWKQPGFTLMAVLTLALAIGANTTIFSVVNGVLLKALPYPEPERLVALAETSKEVAVKAVAYPDYLDWRAQQTVFENLAARMPAGGVLTGGGSEPERVIGRLVTASFFPTLGIQPRLGRFFTDAEDRPGAERVIVLSYELWQRHYGGRAQIVGQSVQFNGESWTVVGVLPAGFDFYGPSQLNNDFLIPLGRLSDQTYMRDRNSHIVFVTGRLKRGVPLAQAQTEMHALTARLGAQFPESNSGNGVRLRSMLDDYVGEVRPALLLLTTAVLLVLLVGCANVANLLLARATTRRKEIALRMALGAGRRRIVRQLLTESLLLATLSGAFGLLLAKWSVELLVKLDPADLPRLESIALDWRALCFTMLVSLATGVAFGLAPALQTANVELNEMLKGGSLQFAGGGRGRRLRDALVIMEVALSLMLLVGAGLLGKSFWRLMQVDPGFDARNVLTLRLRLPDAKYREAAQTTAFLKEVKRRVEALPDVRQVSLATGFPFGRASDNGYWIEGAPEPQRTEDRPVASTQAVSEGYHQTLGITLLAGRYFTERDTSAAPPVVIVDDDFVRRHFPPASMNAALGKRIRFGGDDEPWREVVGVVRHVRQDGLEEAGRAQIYRPWMQINPKWLAEFTRAMDLVVKTKDDPTRLIEPIRREVQAVDKDQPLGNVRTLEALVARSVAPRRFNLLLLCAFAFVALLLGAVGLYGVLSYLVTQRTREIGVRMALGAQASDVLRLIIKHGMTLALIGVGVGLALALALTRLMAGLLYGVSATDPLTFMLIAFVLIFVALLACYLPARRATKVDPLIALRTE
jgi:putative ABC transport system permease protein